MDPSTPEYHGTISFRMDYISSNSHTELHITGDKDLGQYRYVNLKYHVSMTISDKECWN